MNFIENIYYGIGKRKTSISKVILKSGSGKIIINNLLFNLLDLNNKVIHSINSILSLTNLATNYDIFIIVKGGGTNSQIDAINLALSKCISTINNNYKDILKNSIYLKNDSRIKERKKYGLKKARKAPQFTKR